MADSSRWRVRGASDLDAAVVWVGGACTAVGAVAGLVVGWLYGRDDTEVTSDALWYAGVGLVAGAVLGLLVAIGAILVLVVINGRTWATGRPLRAILAAAGAAVPITLLLEVMSGFSVGALVLTFCVVVAGLPAGIATACLDGRACRAAPSRVDPTAHATTSSA